MIWIADRKVKITILIIKLNHAADENLKIYSTETDINMFIILVNASFM